MDQLVRHRKRYSPEVNGSEVTENERACHVEQEDEHLLVNHLEVVSCPSHESRATGDGETCVFCRKKQRVSRKGQIKKADHIELPRSQLLAKLFGFWLYTHHVFVAKVEDHPDFPEDETKVRLTFIESMPTKPYIRETSKNFDLKNDYLTVHLYKQSTFDADESVRRAYERFNAYQRWEHDETDYQGEQSDRTWSPINNCEHFVMRIKTGVSICLQGHHVTDTVVPVTNTIVSKFITLLKSIINFVSTIVDNISNIVGNAGSFSCLIGPLICLNLLVLAAIAVYDLYSYYKLRKNKKLCKGCFYRKTIKVITLLSVSGALLSFGGFGGLGVLGVLGDYGIFLIGTVLPTLIAKTFRKIYTFIMSCFPSRGIPQDRVENLEAVNPGDGITYMYYGLPHQGIVTNVTSDGVCVAHYAWVTWFERKIIEEHISLRDKIRVHDYTDVATYSPEEAVGRVRRRIGEKRFNTLTNRSSHLVAWSKVRMESDDNFDWREVFVWEDVQLGDAIQLWIYESWHDALLVKMLPENKLIEIIYFGHRNGLLSDGIIKCKSEKLDLKLNSLWTQSYKHYKCYETADVIKRARNCVKQQSIILFKTSTEFILYCKVK